MGCSRRGDLDGAATMARARAVVIGAGIGGLAAAAGLHAAGWDVTACERAASLEPVGAGDAVRAPAVGQEIGARRPDGLAMTVGKLAPVALRGLATVYDWHPPHAS